MEGKMLILVLLCVFPTLNANIAEFDQVWMERSIEAKKAARKAFKPNPEAVTDEFNQHVNKDLEGSNKTRRGLSGKYKGPCMATNPIDRCWRCDPNWEKNRQRLADCAIGFGHGTTGGKGGKIYVVNDPSDHDLLNPKPGTLRFAVIQKEPLWIIFKHDMTIKLSSELIVTSHKTIDARGANVHIANGAQMTLQFVKNIIVHGLHIHGIRKHAGGMIRDSVDHFGIRTESDGDGLSLFGATNIWIDHVSLSNCDDGLIDAVAGSTAITISNCHMTRHNDVNYIITFCYILFLQKYFVILLGASDAYSGDQIMQVTLAFNHFGQGLVQRMPRCRWGFFHIVNNDYTHWLMYAVGGSQHPTIVSQGNRFIAPPNPAAKEVTKRDYAPQSVWKNWNWRSEGDLMLNGAFFVESGTKVTNFPKSAGITAKPGSFTSSLTRFAGPLKCVVHKPC
ncbi:pectate lyase-like [Arachis duranensis]|uniref:Pectate lyase n=1 Tax=Arachis duranensis TaxID=130453 RepID=A0A9C6T1J4_ARADU|nr:pectate lyase-like [Arachis duranensis]